MDLVLKVGGGLGKVRFDAFMDIGRDTLHLLAAMHQSPIEEKPSWVIAKVETRRGISMRLAPRTERGTVASGVPTDLVVGIGKLRDVAEIPPAFTDQTLEHVERLGRSAGRRGVEYVELAAANGSVVARERVTSAVIENAGQARHSVEEAFSSVEGVLDVVNARSSSKPWVSLFDPRTRRAVRCDLPPGMRTDALARFGTRVRMFGTLQRNAHGQAIRLQAEGIEPIPDLSLVPPVRFEDLAGAAPGWAGDLDSVEWARAQRASG